MKNLRFFCLLFAVLALLLALGGCDDKQEATQFSSADNGIFYWADTGNGRYVYVGIADASLFDTAHAAFSPKTGNWYAIWVTSSSDGYSDPVSMGVISVNGENLTFMPFPDMGYVTGNLSGTLRNDKLTMSNIPSTSLVMLALEEGGSFSFDPDDPGGSLPVIPGEGQDGETTNAVPFNSGKYITDIVFLDRPVAKTAYEGFPVDLYGMRVEISYNTGEKVIKTEENAKEFAVIPPIYEKSGGVHYLMYIAEYNNQYFFPSDYTERQFKAPENILGQNTVFYEIIVDTPYPYTDPNQLKATVAADIEHFESEPYIALNAVSVKLKYANGEKTLVPSSFHETEFIEKAAPEDHEVVVYIGSKYYAIVPVKQEKYYKVDRIEIGSVPVTNGHLLFDDARFYSWDAENHWLSRLTNAGIRIRYKNTYILKTMNVVEAYFRGWIDIDFPPNLLEKEAKFTYTLRADSGTFSTSQIITVYNRLASISVESLSGGIVLRGNGTVAPDDEQTFLKQVKVSAIYQMGSDKTRTVKRDNVLVYPVSGSTPGSVLVDDQIYLGQIITNVDTGSAGILNTANSKAYDDKKKLSKARVSFTTTSAGDVNQETTKTAIIEIGVTGY